MNFYMYGNKIYHLNNDKHEIVLFLLNSYNTDKDNVWMHFFHIAVVKEILDLHQNFYIYQKKTENCNWSLLPFWVHSGGKKIKLNESKLYILYMKHLIDTNQKKKIEYQRGGNNKERNKIVT